jgi:tripartite motif-containing protein 71
LKLKKPIVLLSLLLIISMAALPGLASALETYTFVSALYGYVPGTPGEDETTYFLGPGEVAVDPSGNLFVIGMDQNAIAHIYTFNSDYDVIPFTFGATFDQPASICFDSAGNIYVSDRLNVRKFSPTGTSLATIGTWYGDVVSFPVVTYGKYPIAITVDAQSNVYATGTGPLEGFPFGFFVYKFSPSGDGYVESGSWGGIGSDTGQFIQPAGIAAYGGYVYVADSENQRVQKFTDSGVYVSQWFINASSPTLPNFNPADLAVDSSGNIFVSIPHSDCVLKFSGSGELLATIGVPHATGSSVEGEFDTPIGVAVDSGGYVYVADMFNSRIQKFAHQLHHLHLQVTTNLYSTAYLPLNM